MLITEAQFSHFHLFKGQFSCGNKHCDEKEGLKSWEVNFGYIEHGEKRNALVKLSKSALQGYVHLRQLSCALKATECDPSDNDTGSYEMENAT